MKEEPILVSEACARSFWNEYRIYDGRVELDGWFYFKTFVIPFDELISIGLFKPPVIRTKLWAMKLDWADLYEHVGITRKNGWIKELRFTPNDPQAFVSKVNEYLSR